MATAPLELRPHQKDAVTAATRILGQQPRTSVIAACGTGKTLIAARTTARIAPRRVLVLLPTLDLLSQTIRSWRLAGRKGTAIAVCSQRQALDHEPLGADVPLTTNPAELAALVGQFSPGPVTVYATYASLPAVIAAHRDHRLPPWDLVVVDESPPHRGPPGQGLGRRPSRRPGPGRPPPLPDRHPPHLGPRRCPGRRQGQRQWPPWTTRPFSVPSPTTSTSPTPSISGCSPTTRSSSPSSPTRTCATGWPPEPARVSTDCTWPAARLPPCAPSTTTSCAAS